MASVQIGLNDAEFRSLQRVLNPKQVRSALTQATKRTTRRGRIMAGDVVRSRLTIRKKFIDAPNSKDAAITQKVVVGDPTVGTVITRDIPLPLSEFNYTDTKTAGVSVRIDTTKPQLTLRHAFAAKVASKQQAAKGISHTGIWTRKKLLFAIQQWTQNNRLGRRAAAASGDAAALAGLTKQMQVVAQARYTPQGIAWRSPMVEARGPTVFDLVSQNDVLDPLVKSIHGVYRDEVGNQISRFTGGRIKSLGALAFDTPDNSD